MPDCLSQQGPRSRRQVIGRIPWVTICAGSVVVLVLSLAVAADEGANGSKPAAGPDPAVYGREISDLDTQHWAFQPLSKAEPPTIAAGGEWVKNPIDAFVLQGLQQKGLQPSPPAENRAWLRRVYFDLTGLPPTPEAVDKFLADPSMNAREKVVDQLLADPGYGIRWGRHWLDVVRYADTNGYERDGEKPHSWRYRDYVIDSFNADKPFYQFLTEQLAGDELEGANAETLIATTFLRLGTWDDEPADPMIDRYDQLDDMVRSVSSTFLGMSLGCARCHNHKFEPLSQIDYAKMLAFFEPLKRPQNGRTDLDVAVGTREQLARHQELMSRSNAAVKGVEDSLKALDVQVRERYLANFEATQTRLSREAFDAHRLPDDKRNDEQKKLVKDTSKQLKEELAQSRTPDEAKQREQLEKAIAAIRAGDPAPLPRAYIWEEQAKNPPVTQVLRRGDPKTPAGEVPAGFPAVLAAYDIPLLQPDEKARTSQRRLTLVKWMTDARQPLVARVAVNRLWQGHFGDGLVSTENDFGVMGDAPSNPALLDWLALQFQQSGGRMKALHKLIVLSNTYGQASTWREEAAKVDPENELLWRFPYRRLDAEAIRDAILSVNGQLNPKMGGPGVYPKIANEILAGQSMPGNGWGKFDEREASRRGAYIFVKRSLLVPEMELMDFADTNASCEQRSISTIPTQALTYLNGEFLNTQARHFAERVLGDAGSEPSAQVDRAYRLAFGRSPDQTELAAGVQYLERQRQQLSQEVVAESQAVPDAAKIALQSLCLVLYNLNEFVYAD